MPAETVDLSDPKSIEAWVATALASVLSVVALVHPGFHLPVAVQAVVPSVGFLVAGAVGIYKLFTGLKARELRARSSFVTQAADAYAAERKGAAAVKLPGGYN